jgi:uncharacterized membrane protein
MSFLFSETIRKNILIVFCNFVPKNGGSVKNIFFQRLILKIVCLSFIRYIFSEKRHRSRTILFALKNVVCLKKNPVCSQKQCP